MAFLKTGDVGYKNMQRRGGGALHGFIPFRWNGVRLPAAPTPLYPSATASEQELLEPERGVGTTTILAGENADGHQDISDAGSHGLPDR